jgi:hypothetical protein
MPHLLGGLFVLIVCPLLGALPLQRLPQSLQRWQLWVEAMQGLIAVGVTKLLFPVNPEWEIMALMGLAAGRFWMRQTGGIWSTIAGYMLHDPLSGFLVALFGLIGTTVFRQNQQITLALLALMPLMTALRHSRSAILILLTAGLAGILFGMEQKRPIAQAKAQLKLFRADSLDDPLMREKVGQPAFRLSQLYQSGLPIPPGWILYPGDDPNSLPQAVQPSLRSRWLVRSSFVSTNQTSQVLADLMSVREVWGAIVQHFEAYARSSDQANMAVLIQPQMPIAFAGRTDCQTPTLKADVPSVVAQAVLSAIDKINDQHLDIQTIEWIYDGEKVWIMNAI